MEKRTSEERIEWRWIPGYENYYEASNTGLIRSYWNNRYPSKTPRVLVASAGPRGYRTVCLCLYGQRREVCVHTLILEAFVGPRPEGLEACHGSGGQLDNSIQNLRWDTRKSNRRDALEAGTLWREGSGVKATLDLTPEQVLDICDSVSSQRSLAKKHGVSHPSIGRIKRDGHPFYTKHWAQEQIAMLNLKAQGLKPGVSDLVIA